MASLRTRAASLLRSSFLAPPETIEEEPNEGKLPTSSVPQDLEYHALTEKSPCDDQTSNGELSMSISSAGKTLNTCNTATIENDIDVQRLVRAVPTWVHSLNEDDEDSSPTPLLLPPSPPGVQVASHNSTPSPKPKTKSEPPRGRLFDLQREWAPPVPSGPVSENASQWKAFAQSSAYPAVSGEVGELVTEDWLIKNGADYSLPWLAGPENEETENDGSNLFRFHKHRQVWWKRFHGVVIRSPMIPLVLRTIVWIFSLIALILGSSIHKLANKLKSPEVVNGSSPKLAIVVDAIALVYIIYITYDEYTGKPLGLRSATAKMRLVFLDLFFIVFDSANLSLAFFIVSKSNLRCDGDSVDARICHQQKGLASVLLIALIAWLMTFSISMFRLFERVTGK